MVVLFECTQCGDCCRELKQKHTEDDLLGFVQHWSPSTPRHFYQLLGPEQTTISLFGWEKDRLVAKAAELGIEFDPVPSAIAVNDLEPGVRIVLLWDMNADPCCFLDDDGRCRIWGSHPLRCRSYPLRSLELEVDESGIGLLAPRQTAPPESGDDCDPECCFVTEHPDTPVVLDALDRVAFVRLKEFEQYANLFLSMWEQQHAALFRLVRNESRAAIMARNFIATIDILDYGRSHGFIPKGTIEMLVEMVEV